MTVMTMESKHALVLGFSLELVSRLYVENFFILAHYLSNDLAHWCQTYFRPNKPLPTNVGSNQSGLPVTPCQPFKWTLINFVVSCLFLRIPYVFFERTRLSSRIMDEESGLRYATPTLVIGACTCLVVSLVHLPFF